MTDTPRTPPILYLLGLLVVAAVAVVYFEMRGGTASDLERWRAEPLTLPEIRAGLTGGDTQARGHALVQLARLVGARREADEDQGDLAALVPELERLAKSEDRTTRLLVPVAATYMKNERITPLLLRLLEDSDRKVGLNAAIGLAGRGHAGGADLLAEAIEATRGDQGDARRELLGALRHVAQERHRELLRGELKRAELDRDSWAERFCREALERLGPG